LVVEVVLPIVVVVVLPVEDLDIRFELVALLEAVPIVVVVALLEAVHKD
jgi:hypothetical protein